MARLAHAKNKRENKGNDAPTPSREGGARGPAEGAAGRGIWSGSISFGLLQIPVTLHTAERRAEELHFRLLDKRDLSPIRYERVNATSGEPVEWKDIVKGYEVDKDTFVVVDPDDLARANVKATQTIDIQDFIPRDQIDMAYFETPYWIVPQRRASKAYLLLREALERKGAVAVATFVLRTREHLVAILPNEGGLMLEILRFGHELKAPGAIPFPRTEDGPAVTDRELAMAEQLIDAMMTNFNPAKYKDHYHADVMKMIEDKAKTGTVKERYARAKGAVAHDVVDLLSLLKKSVAASERAANDERSAPKKARPRKTAARGPRRGKAA